MFNQNSLAGPFGMMDHVGLNVLVDAMQSGFTGDPDNQPQLKAALDFLNAYIERGDLGVKTGKGFYTYPDPEFFTPEFLAGHEENKDLSSWILDAFYFTGLLLVIEGIATLEAVDQCWMLIHQCEAGPFGLMDQKGLDLVQSDLAARARQLEETVDDADELREQQKQITTYLKAYIDEGRLGLASNRGFYSYPDPAFKKPEFLVMPD